MVGLSDPNVVQTEDICICAVEQDGLALQYVKNQTETICICAVKENWRALKYVKNQTEAICLCAVKQDGGALQYVKNQTKAICWCAVEQDGYALKYVHNQTEAMCICAVKNCAYALKYVRNQTENICVNAVKQCIYALKYVRNQTDAMCLEAIANHKINTKLTYCIYNTLKYPTPQLISILVKLYPSDTDEIMTHYAEGLMKTYKKCSDIINLHLVRHSCDLLYRPNNVNALFCRTAPTSAKSVFLTKS